MAKLFPSLNNSEKKESLASKEQADKQAQKMENLEQTSEVAKGVEGTVEGAMEGLSNGEISEGLSEENKGKQAGAGTFTGGSKAAQALLAKQIKIPSVDVMQQQVEIEIKKQIHVLEKEASKIMMNPAKFSPFTLNGLVSKIRELKDILSMLAYATLETVKSWWLKYVRGISI